MAINQTILGGKSRPAPWSLSALQWVTSPLCTELDSMICFRHANKLASSLFLLNFIVTKQVFQSRNREWNTLEEKQRLLSLFLVDTAKQISTEDKLYNSIHTVSYNITKLDIKVVEITLPLSYEGRHLRFKIEITRSMYGAKFYFKCNLNAECIFLHYSKDLSLFQSATFVKKLR